MTRVKNSINNLAWAAIGQAIGIIVSFISRIFFLRVLGGEYLGLNGLFTNILTVLSLAELGVGTAITYSLYKPLQQKDEKETAKLMKLYKTVYRVIGIIILILGISIAPFLKIFIKDIPESIPNIELIYSLFVINTGISYFYSYKRNLIIADQHRYIATIYRYASYIIMNIIQIIYLLITRDYYGFLIIQILATVIENIMVSIKANRMYPFLKEKNVPNVDKEVKKEIVKNTKAMMMHKIGGIVVNSTDNIIISSYVGLVAVGIYSNYYLIITALNMVIGQIYTSITPSIGNLCVESDKEKQYDIFRKIDFFMFWISSFSSITLLCLYNSFIELWVGKEYLFAVPVVLVIVANFYLTTMRKASLAFRDATGLFYKDRYKALFEALINLVTSIILVLKFGVIGVFIGTFISSITTCVWVEPFILFKYNFKKSFLQYCKTYFIYLIFTLVVGAITYFVCNYINISNLIDVVIKLSICIVFINLCFVLLFHRTKEYKYYKNLIFKIIKSLFNKIAKVIKR